MTIIDTTLYANGALRLSRHGAGKGGNVLLHIASGRQIEMQDHLIPDMEAQIAHMAGRVDSEILFSALRRIYAPDT